MQILNLSNNHTYNKPTNFTGSQNKPLEFYNKLNKEFLTEAKKQGFTKSTIITIIERMQLSPKFDSKSMEEVCAELMQKFNAIIERINNGISPEELCSIFKIKPKNAKSILHQHELNERNKLILESFNKGHSLKEISKEFNIAGETIRLVLKEAGINLKEYSAQIYKRVIDMFIQGFNEVEIAGATRLSPSTINTYRQRLRFSGEKIPTKTETRHRRVLEMLKQGMKRKDVAKEMNLKVATVNKIAQKNHITDIHKAEQEKTVIEYLKHGFPTKEIAKRLNISKTTIFRIAQNNNIELKIDYTGRNQAILEALKTKDARTVAKEFNLNCQTIYNIKYLAQKLS